MEKNGVRHAVKEGMRFLIIFPEDSRYYLDKNSEEAWTFLYLRFAGDALVNV